MDEADSTARGTLAPAYPVGASRQDTPHDIGRDRVKVSAALDVESGLICQPQITFVHQSGRIKRELAALAFEARSREPN